jgi:hypothetical protein
MIHLQTKNPNIGLFLKALVYFVVIWYCNAIWCRYTMAIWYILW